jgi:hypothetical protein
MLGDVGFGHGQHIQHIQHIQKRIRERTGTKMLSFFSKPNISKKRSGQQMVSTSNNVGG